MISIYKVAGPSIICFGIDSAGIAFIFKEDENDTQ